MRPSSRLTAASCCVVLTCAGVSAGQEPLCPPAPAFSGQLCEPLQESDCVAATPADACWPRSIVVGAAGMPSALSCGCFSAVGCGPIGVTPTAIPEDYVLSCLSACQGNGGPCGLVINNVPTGQAEVHTFPLNPGDVVQCICTEVPPPVCPQPPDSNFCAGFESDCLSLDFSTLCLPARIRISPQQLPEPEACSCLVPDGDCGPIQVDRTLLSCAGECPAIASCQVLVNSIGTGMTQIDSTVLPPGALVSCGCSEAPPQFEACCMLESALTCFMIDVSECLRFGGDPQGPGSECLGLEACCLTGGDCQFIDRLCCLDLGGAPLGPDSMCAGQGACCLDIDDGPLAYDTCVQADQICCEGGVFQGVGSTCDIQACCLATGGCQETDAECCQASGGVPLGPGSTCGNPPCPATGACCFDIDDGPLAYDTCMLTDEQSCIEGGGLFQGPGSACDIQACCLPTGYCQETDAECCQASGGVPLGPGSSCSGIPTCPAIGACCFDQDGDSIPERCEVLDSPHCRELGGSFHGPGSTCQGAGACCFGITGGACAVMDRICCQSVGGGNFLGCGATCLGDSNNDGFDDRCTCPADLNGDGQINAADLAILLGAWGNCACCPADFNLDGVVDAADLAALLGSWGQCP